MGGGGFDPRTPPVRTPLEGPLHLKPWLQNEWIVQHDYKLPVQNEKTMRCFKSKDNAKRVLFFLLAHIDRTEERKRALHERYTDTRHPFLCMVLRVLLL